jgi:hypothetical protein
MSESYLLDVPFPRTISVVSFRLSVISLDLGVSVRLAVHLECLSGEKSFNDYKEIIIEGDEYLAWGSDDSYIVGLVKTKLESIL